MRRGCLIFLMVFLVGTPQQVWAWGPEGHRLIGALADRLLTGTKAAAKLKVLLQGAGLAQVATWGDCVKNIRPEQDFAYVNSGHFTDCAWAEAPREIAFMADFVRRNHRNCQQVRSLESCHKRYHYTDVSILRDSYQANVVDAGDDDIVHAIQAAIAVLTGHAAPAPFHLNEKEALLLLIHLVGDLHQPLHVGAVYLDDSGALLDPDNVSAVKARHTFGGNALQVGTTNLHAMWDAVPTSARGVANEERLTQSARLFLKQKPAMSVELWPLNWACGSLLDARAAFVGIHYGINTPNQRGDHWIAELPLEYEARMTKMKEIALAKAGARLTQLLLQIYGS